MPEDREVYEVEQDLDQVCPLRMIAYNKYPESTLAQSHVRCLKDKCAWWDKSDHRCGILSICYDIAKAGSY